jgi:hypothetical protein
VLLLDLEYVKIKNWVVNCSALQVTMSKSLRQPIIAILLGISFCYLIAHSSVEQLHVIFGHNGNNLSETHLSDKEQSHLESGNALEVSTKGPSRSSSEPNGNRGHHHIHCCLSVHLNIQSAGSDLTFKQPGRTLKLGFIKSIMPRTGVFSSQFRPPIS